MFKRLFLVSLLSFSFGGALQAMNEGGMPVESIIFVQGAQTRARSKRKPVPHTCVCSLDAVAKAMQVGHMKYGDKFDFQKREGDTVMLVKGFACCCHFHFTETRLRELTQSSATQDDMEPEN